MNYQLFHTITFNVLYGCIGLLTIRHLRARHLSHLSRMADATSEGHHRSLEGDERPRMRAPSRGRILQASWLSCATRR